MKRTTLGLLLLAAVTLLPADGAIDLVGEWRREFKELERQMKDRGWSARVAGQVENPAALIEAGDRDPLDVVVRRTQVLLAFLQSQPGAPDLSTEAKALGMLVAEAATIAVDQKGERYACYERVAQLRRAIAFRNPLLDFDRLVFLTKHRPMAGDHHMVDQYYGFNARPGGGLFMLEAPFSDAPRARDLMEGVTVGNGRLAGRALTKGVFNTLDLDFDGETLAFAWSECEKYPEDADRSGQPSGWSMEEAKKRKRANYYWAPDTCYHIIKFRLGEENVEQLTDGAFQDFDPCFLPNGRIAFMSERRGGFLRCGANRPNPSYTLHAMMRDGSDIIPLSYHETNEWNPSVNNDGMIAYTRWDYVDRDNDIAHHLWLCHPDGRDPRSFHGNYPSVRESRPWMEMSIRAIPGSDRYVAVAAPHHGYNYGSLVLLDHTVPDDGAMRQIKRLTPEAHFPESESAPGVAHHPRGRHQPNGEVYGTPWPLSEEFHLCVYDPGHSNYGIYLVDCFGNRELIWRDPEVACLDPIPLRARPRPPVLPAATCQALADRKKGQSGKASVAIVNVYESDFEWPEGTKIAGIRVVQLFPKSTYHLDDPEVGVGDESLVRGVIGTAPVEQDGSANFEAPAGVPIYFQAIDEQGRAVQSMRSATYLHRGERLTCVGCHENKHEGPSNPGIVPMAWQREPSRLEPPPEGAYPVSFPRLVQPVIESAKVADKHGWSESFVNLRPFAWAWSGGNGIILKEGPRSPVGKIGAKGSRLLPLLEGDHYGLKLNEEEMRRFVLWLDTNSNFYGAYRKLEEQAKGECVMPAVE